jgi:hypothetical protein
MLILHNAQRGTRLPFDFDCRIADVVSHMSPGYRLLPSLTAVINSLKACSVI